MVSEERRMSKPYAVPVLYIPCQTLRDKVVRELIGRVKDSLVTRGLHVVGVYMIKQ